jgi:hypothetical protein
VILQAIRNSIFGIVIVFIAIQAIPYGRDHAGSPISEEPIWDSDTTWQLAQRACFDCHSNRTNWPWYSVVAPVSWVIQRDVDKGRSQMNFSRWDLSQREARKAPREVLDGEMPLWYYTLAHPEARLSAEEKEVLARGLEATIGRKR